MTDGKSDNDPHTADLGRSEYEATPEVWRGILNGDELPVLEVANRLASARDLAPEDAEEAVYAAVEEGILVEDTEASTFGRIRLTDEYASKNGGEGVAGYDGDAAQDSVNDTYRDLYLTARDRADADSAFVPQEDIVAVFAAEGYGDIVGDLRYHDDWIVWTPETRETPLYAYTPDLAGDTSTERERIADLLAEAGVGRERFIKVHDAQKGSFDTGNARPPDDDAISGNYGIKGGRGGDDGGRWLVDIDVDDYDEAKATNARVEELRGNTLGVASAHTTTDRPGHLYVAVDGDPRDVVADVLGREVENPAASFGEIRIANQYVVGPGSEVLCGCDRCTDADAPDHFGRYELATDTAPVVWSKAEFRAFLEADPAIERQAKSGASEGDSGRSGRPTADSAGALWGDTDGWVDLAKTADDHVRDALRGVRAPDDRSKADSALARAVAPWLNYDRDAVADVLDDHGTGKWDARGDSYRASVLDYALARDTDAYRPVPYWAVVEVAVRDGLVDRDDLVDRDSDTGDVVDDTDGDTYTALPPGTYNDVIRHIRETYGVDPGREPVETDSQAGEEDPRDLLALDVVVEPANALAAAGAVEPADLDADLPELERNDVDDVVIAVALAEGWIDSPEEFPDDGRYTRAYYRARDRYGAPLPKYLDNTALEERDDLVFAALDRVRPEHVLDSCRSEVTVADPSGEAIAKLDPTWEDSESGERILAGYGRGFYCVEHAVSFSPLQLAALEAGLIDSETAYPRGEAFKEAYRLLREAYGAPLPKWRATLLEHVAVLPSAVRLLDDDLSADPGETLAGARDLTEALIRDAVGVRDRAQLLTSLPGTGKTYGVVATSDDVPTAYLTRRNELKAQAENYAAEVAADDEHHPDSEPSVAHLPILAEDRLPEEARIVGVAAIREHGRELLRDPDALLEYVEPHLDDEEEDVEDDDAVDLQRPTCPTGEGHHGEAWRVRLQIAHALPHTPAEIHRRDEALFGEEIPCQHDGDCRLSLGWERVRDPDDPVDLLIGSPQHARVASTTTHFSRGPDGDRVATARAVALDEFPEDAYVSDYGDRFMDHAVWGAESVANVDSREDLLGADLASDTWVNLWIDGEGGEYAPAADALEALDAARSLAGASSTAADLLDDDRVAEIAADTSANVRRLRTALETLAAAAPQDDDRLDEVADRLQTARGRLEDDAATAYAGGRDVAGRLYALVDDLEAVLDDLTGGLDAVDHGDAGLLATVRERVDALPVGGDLRALLEAAVDATRGEAPDGLLDAAATALRGGREGCRELALFASDGYAHPDAWALLAGAIADVEADDVREVRQPHFGFDGEVEGGVFKRTRRNGATIIADKNHHGAVVVDPPAFTDATGEKCPLLGLDATGRPELWRHAIGRDVERRDIHDTPAERRRFLRDVVGLQVVQTTDSPLSYHGPPDGKNFQEDLELVETVAEEYTGDGPDAVDEKGPAVLSTKKVLSYLNDELEAHAGATVNYEAMKGSDALAEHQVAVLLGTQHYSHAVPEKWALIAGEAADPGDTRGGGLDYGSDVANAYLRHMREDHLMQAALRVGRNDADTVVFAHTSALREDLPVVGESAVVSAHSQGTLAVAEAAAEFRSETFTAREVADAIVDDDCGVGLRQVQNILANLREAGYLRVLEEPAQGRAGEYELADDPGRADIELPDLEVEAEVTQNETPRNGQLYTWNFTLDSGRAGSGAGLPPSTAVIAAGDTNPEVIATAGPPG